MQISTIGFRFKLPQLLTRWKVGNISTDQSLAIKDIQSSFISTIDPEIDRKEQFVLENLICIQTWHVTRSRYIYI